MSRIGLAPITIPDEVSVKPDGQKIEVKGPKGTLSVNLPVEITLSIKEKIASLACQSKTARVKALHGLSRALLANAIEGTSKGFSKDLEIIGIGYRASLQGNQLILNVGYSHPVVMDIPNGISVKIAKPTQISVSGFDKHLVGQFTANIRRSAPPEPYKGKGIKYVDEVIRRKAGKAATGAKSG